MLVEVIAVHCEHADLFLGRERGGLTLGGSRSRRSSTPPTAGTWISKAAAIGSDQRRR
jgi:hypothetical protein